MTDDPLMSRQEAAEYLGVTVDDLVRWQQTRKYLFQTVKVGHLVKYRKSDLDLWKRLHPRGEVKLTEPEATAED